jgi:PPOX class probable F420-dependent enzyme
MLSDGHRRFLAAHRVGHLATADAAGAPHVVPVCFALAEANLYITIDEKPKRTDRPLKRVTNILENPTVAVVVDCYDENWEKLGWVMLRGRADILGDGAEHREAQALLRARYQQLRAMRIEQYPVIAVRIARVAAWGNLCSSSEEKA